ncbi:hypothetical protein ACFOLF_14115 [Paenibacillus sepulcri]|uniref:Phospholipase C/D domain-containing protein n=1 Tax=Paenibacillus sepulcri TaxID=359917 RepID=A0ABS7BXT1_9BACL|nr:hypothetical protein [Paenibacillus sepulcri]
MPWPMVHFALSTNISFANPSPNLLIGSIAPDAVHMRGNISREEKGITHLVRDNQLPAKELIMEKCLEYLSIHSEVEWKDYILGYFTHIYTDLRWTEAVYSGFENDYHGDKNEIRKIYNNEVSQIEFNLLRSMDNVDNLFSRLTQAKAYTIEPFVTLLEVNQYRDNKLNWLQNNDNEPKIKPAYFHPETVKNFISQTSNELKDLFKVWGITFIEESRITS